MLNRAKSFEIYGFKTEINRKHNAMIYVKIPHPMNIVIETQSLSKKHIRYTHSKLYTCILDAIQIGW